LSCVYKHLALTQEQSTSQYVSGLYSIPIGTLFESFGAVLGINEEEEEEEEEKED
jgi:hypothetical protein